MAFTQKYTIVQFVESVADGAAYPYTKWPLHVTLADVFAIDWDVPALVIATEQALHAVTPFQTIAQQDTYFGPNKEVQVTLLEKRQPLVNLHASLVAALRPGNVRFNTPEYTLEGFTPHATVQRDNRLHEGDQVSFNALSIIDMFPNGDPYQRVILKTIPFGQA